MQLNNLSLDKRMLFFSGSFFVFVIAVILLSFIFKLSFNEMRDQSYEMLHADLDRATFLLSKKLTMISIDAVKMSGDISRSIDTLLGDNDMSIKEFCNSPGIVEDVLCENVLKATNVMNRNACSGVFVILNATVNSQLPDSDGSKSCFYIKDVEPFKTLHTKTNLYLFRGAPSIARKFNMYLHTQWDLEYNINLLGGDYNADFFNKPFNAAISHPRKSIISLGYWGPFGKIAENSEKAMTFSVPLIDKDGNTFGVCGLELSQRFFEASLPAISSTNNEQLFFMLSLAHGDSVNVENAGFSGNSAGFLTPDPQYITAIQILNNARGIKLFKTDIGERSSYIGTDKEIALYTAQSVFSNEHWVLTALVPEDEVNVYNRHLTFLWVLALCMSGSVLFYLTYRYYKALHEKTSLYVQENKNFLEETPPHEQKGVSSLLDNDNTPLFSENNMAETSHIKDSSIQPEQIKEFAEKLKSFTKTEKELFDLYIAGYTANEICRERCITKNTIKTHNKHIYSKMNVSSRTELLDYCIPFINNMHQN